MKRTYIYTAMLLALAIFSGCEVKPWEEEIPGIVSIAQTGIVTLEPYNVGEMYKQSLITVKAGMLDAPTTVTFAAAGNLLDSINKANYTDYKLLPTSCYQLEQPTVSMPDGVRRGETFLSYDPEKIQELSGYGNTEYALPVIASSEGMELNNSRNLVVYLFKVMEPDVRMLQSQPESFTITADGAVPDIKAQIGVLFGNKWDIGLTLVPNEADVDAYNEANGTYYSLLPTTAYTLDPAAPVLPNGSNTTTVAVKISKEKLSQGNYILPLKLTAVSKFKIYEKANTATFQISYPGNKIDKKEWTATANTEEAVGEPTGGGRAIHLIDDDLNTFWHSQWANSAKPPLPHVITIDMKKNIQIGRVDVARRAGTAGVKFFNLEGSTDGVNWVSMGEFSLIQADGLKAYIVKPTTARYIRMIIPEKQGGTVSHMGELTVYGTVK